MTLPRGFETDMDTQRSNEPESAPFETIEPEKTMPSTRKSKLGSLAKRSFRKMKS
jgi:hypothetical protein